MEIPQRTHGRVGIQTRTVRCYGRQEVQYVLDHLKVEH